MFEDSLMESQNRLSSPNQRWTTALSLTLQCLLAAAIVALPLLRPEALPFHVDVPKVMLPLKPLPRPIPRTDTANTQSASPAAPTTGQPMPSLRRIPTGIFTSSDAPPFASISGTGMSDPNGLPSGIGTSVGTGPNVSIAPASTAPKSILHVSTGVLAGLLQAPITPIYPRIAVTARIEGAIKVEAVISKSGRIESAHVVSGPEILRQSALDAIRSARYTPYMLNGSPTEVETTITVNFKLSS